MTPFEDLLWRAHRTVLVLGPVSRAAWWPPAGDLPGVLVAPGEKEAKAMLDRIVGMEAL